MFGILDGVYRAEKNTGANMKVMIESITQRPMEITVFTNRNNMCMLLLVFDNNIILVLVIIMPGPQPFIQSTGCSLYSVNNIVEIAVAYAYGFQCRYTVYGPKVTLY